MGTHYGLYLCVQQQTHNSNFDLLRCLYPDADLSQGSKARKNLEREFAKYCPNNNKIRRWAMHAGLYFADQSQTLATSRGDRLTWVGFKDAVNDRNFNQDFRYNCVRTQLLAM